MEITEREDTPLGFEAAGGDGREAGEGEGLEVTFEPGAVTRPVETGGFGPESGTRGLFLEGDRDKTPMVCPMVVVCPDRK